MTLTKAKGTRNLADMVTKFLAAAELRDMMQRLGLQVMEGRAALAPHVAEDTSLMEESGGPQEDQLGLMEEVSLNLLESVSEKGCWNPGGDPRIPWRS